MNAKQVNPDLTDDQKEVLFNKGTETPFTGEFLHNKKTGMYTCANCGRALFDSNTKFDAPPPNEGWPSFSEVAKSDAVRLENDDRYGVRRTEVMCDSCGAHLGHLFSDGPTKSGGKHYCINSCALDFKPKNQ